jgi:transcriptional regulator with PAS, ATPase and Fis domain
MEVNLNTSEIERSIMELILSKTSRTCHASIINNRSKIVVYEIPHDKGPTSQEEYVISHRFDIQGEYEFIISENIKPFTGVKTEYWGINTVHSTLNLTEDEKLELKDLANKLISILVENKVLEDPTEKFRKNVVCYSESIKVIVENIKKVGPTEHTVLLTGEIGVGKTYLAELIHHLSRRKGKFIRINMPNVSETLFESTLFGHKKGAYTDAKNDKTGFVAEAEHGTLFFDEITEVPMLIQSKLLRLIENKEYHVLGDSKEHKANIRIVAATNQDIDALIKEKKFREDLYWRLRTFEYLIPPLRNRKPDILPLVEKHKEFLNNKAMGFRFKEVMEEYDWPGNIRELKMVLIRAGVHCEGEISGDDIQKQFINHTVGHTQPSKFLKNKDKNGPDKLGHTAKIQTLFEEAKSGLEGKNFWTVIKEPYLERDLNREEVKTILRKGLLEAGGKYVKLVELFHLDPKDYNLFMSFLYDNKLR